MFTARYELHIINVVWNNLGVRRANKKIWPISRRKKLAARICTWNTERQLTKQHKRKRVKNVNLSLCKNKLLIVPTLKAYGGDEAYFYSLLTSALNGEQRLPPSPGRYYQKKKWRIQFGRLWEEKNFLPFPEIELRLSHHSARSLSSIQTELSGILLQG